MKRTITTRTRTRTTASALIVMLAIAFTAVPARAGTPPTITSFSPGSGAVGTTVTITGTGFTGATSVRFNGTWSAPNVASDTSISATVPAGATTGRISVTTPGGTGQSATDFVVGGSGGLPRFSDFNPKSGPVGTTVVIDGNNYNGATAVRFNGTSATFTVNSNTRITATVPPSATTGKISVTTPAGTAQTERNFQVNGPTIHSLSPNTGPVGTSVTINGSGFTGVTAVRFNGTSATFSFVSASRANAVVPDGATTGRVTLTTPAGTATSPGNFTVSGGVHARSLSLFLGRGSNRAKLFATGSVTANDGYSACERHVPVVIKRLRGGTWRWVTTTSSGANGSFRTPMPNKGGWYRAKALKITLVNGAVCSGRLSNVVRYHR
jgi:hypothetical protein